MRAACSPRSTTEPERSASLKLCRFSPDRVGVVDGDWIRDVTPAIEQLPCRRWPLPPGDALITHLDALRPHMERLLLHAPALAVERAHLQSPVANPGKVIAVRGNYPGASSGAPGEPQLVLKASSSVVGPGAGLELRFPGRRVDHEVELVAVIGRRVDRVARESAPAAVAGYCIGIDATLRGDEDRGLRKSLDGHTVLGPWLTTADGALDLADAGIELAVNGRLRQSGRTSQMTLDVPAIIAWASRYFVLEPGDIVMTGTPSGVGPLAAGDEVCCAIEGLGAMRVTIR